MSDWRQIAEQAQEKLDLADAYLDDGALHTGALRLREAADLFEQAAHQRDAAMDAHARQDGVS